MKVTLELAFCLQQVARPNLGGAHPISPRPEEDKKADRPLTKREFSRLMAFEMGQSLHL